jgi:hypothetical protein
MRCARCSAVCTTMWSFTTAFRANGPQAARRYDRGTLARSMAAVLESVVHTAEAPKRNLL